MIAWTIQETHRFYSFLIDRWHNITVAILFAFSNWRRRHQYQAKRSHMKKRAARLSANT